MGNLYTSSTIQDLPTAHWGVHLGVVKSWFLMDFWQIQRIYALVMMSETVGIDIHEIEHIMWVTWIWHEYVILLTTNAKFKCRTL